MPGNESEKKWFECARCGRESEVTATPPRCPYCGSANGTISVKPPRKKDKDEPPRGPKRKDN
jgi:DNA-directed RNA polymerase subunit RPC12/RpoP